MRFRDNARAASRRVFYQTRACSCDARQGPCGLPRCIQQSPSAALMAPSSSDRGADGCDRLSAWSVNRRAWILMGALAALWGASYMFIKVALDDVSPRASIVCAAHALGGAACCCRSRAAAARSATSAAAGAGRSSCALRPGRRAVPADHLRREAHLLVAGGDPVSSAPIFTALLALRFDHAERSRRLGARRHRDRHRRRRAAVRRRPRRAAPTSSLGGAMVLGAASATRSRGCWSSTRLPGVPPAAIAGGTMFVARRRHRRRCSSPRRRTGAGARHASRRCSRSARAGPGIAFLIFYTLIAEIGPARARRSSRYVAPGFSSSTAWSCSASRSPSRRSPGPRCSSSPGRGSARRGGCRGFLSRSGPSRSSAPAPARAR